MYAQTILRRTNASSLVPACARRMMVSLLSADSESLSRRKLASHSLSMTCQSTQSGACTGTTSTMTPILYQNYTSSSLSHHHQYQQKLPSLSLKNRTYSHSRFLSSAAAAAAAAARSSSVFVCSGCGYEHSKWQGQCDDCAEWNTLEERKSSRSLQLPKGSSSNSNTAIESRAKNEAGWLAESASKPIRLSDISSRDVPRIVLPENPQVNQVFGGGIVPGSLMLLAAPPGAGKSTFCMQLASKIAGQQPGSPVLYNSGEETLTQLKLRADRLKLPNIDDVLFCNENSCDRFIHEQLAVLRPSAFIVDSIQTIYTDTTATAMGSVGQIRECGARLLRAAKSLQIPALIIGHVTKSGDVSGPRTLEHLVDVVLYLEPTGSQQLLLRSTKNRFGSSGDIAILEMSDLGLTENANPSAAFLSQQHSSDAIQSGSVVTSSMEGNRPLMVEVQALVTKMHGEYERHRWTGLENERFFLLLAVMQKHLKLRPNYSVFVNVVGGLRVTEPAADLAVLLAVMGSYRDMAVPAQTAVAGEVGLAGEVRSVPSLGRRITEAAKLGFSRFIIPECDYKHALPAAKRDGIQLIPVRHVLEAVSILQNLAQ
jgi:DNA repair protein RadA/Sms